MGTVRVSLEFLLCFTMFTQTVFLLFLLSLSLGQVINSTEECPDPYETIYNVKGDSNCAHYGENYFWCRPADQAVIKGENPTIGVIKLLVVGITAPQGVSILKRRAT